MLQFHLSRLNLGEIQDVVNQRQEMPATGFNGLYRTMYVRWQIGPALQDLGVAEDSVHRGADFVAHVGEEGALGTIRRFRCISGDFEFTVFRFNDFTGFSLLLKHLIPQLPRFAAFAIGVKSENDGRDQQCENGPARWNGNPPVEIPRRNNLQYDSGRFRVVEIPIYRLHCKGIGARLLGCPVKARFFRRSAVLLDCRIA